jgi:hypothetical protein
MGLAGVRLPKFDTHFTHSPTVLYDNRKYLEVVGHWTSGLDTWSNDLTTVAKWYPVDGD